MRTDLSAVFGGGAGVGPDGVEAGVAEHVGDSDQIGAAADEGGREGVQQITVMFADEVNERRHARDGWRCWRASSDLLRAVWWLQHMTVSTIRPTIKLRT